MSDASNQHRLVLKPAPRRPELDRLIDASIEAGLTARMSNASQAIWVGKYLINGSVGCMSDAPTAQPKPFGKAMVETYEGIKRDFGNKPAIDQNVREQVDADLDGLIEKNRARKW